MIKAKHLDYRDRPVSPSVFTQGNQARTSCSESASSDQQCRTSTSCQR
ncbi:hypothetical protein OK016_27720 [Vibrio chagasii]|nr:hypothetical protein [Vibrio chagasii]